MTNSAPPLARVPTVTVIEAPVVIGAVQMTDLWTLKPGSTPVVTLAVHTNGPPDVLSVIVIVSVAIVASCNCAQTTNRELFAGVNAVVVNVVPPVPVKLPTLVRERAIKSRFRLLKFQFRR